MAARCLAFVILVALAQHQRVLCGSEQPPNLVPISIPPSQYWDGNDGLWSTFGIQLGTPPQSIRVLPSTSSSALWPVLPEGCPSSAATAPTCPSDRGFNFHPNTSASWRPRGLYKLPLYPLDALNYTGNALYGFDNVTLSWPGQGGVALVNQVVAGIATKDFWVGMLGLSPRPVNFTDFLHPEPSILGTLAAEGKVPSAAWGYTAGAQYRPRQPFASLTLGGYDAARFVPNNITFPFGADSSRILLVVVHGITTATTTTIPSATVQRQQLLPTPIIASIDSTIPHIWLPLEACQAFESAFSIAWDAQAERYILNATHRQTLLAQNASITFTLGPQLPGGATVSLEMPWASFDLKLTAAATDGGGERYYFPLRRAENATQYTLGRTFLQEAYIIVDYTRGRFSVSQTAFPDTNNPPEDLVPIFPPSNGTGTLPPPPPPRHPGGLRVPGPVIAAVISVAVLLTLAGLTFYALRRRWSRRMEKPAEMEKPVELPVMERQEIGAADVEVEMEAEGAVYEADGTAAAVEMDTVGARRRSELERRVVDVDVDEQERRRRRRCGVVVVVESPGGGVREEGVGSDGNFLFPEGWFHRPPG